MRENEVICRMVDRVKESVGGLPLPLAYAKLMLMLAEALAELSKYDRNAVKRILMYPF